MNTAPLLLCSKEPGRMAAFLLGHSEGLAGPYNEHCQHSTSLLSLIITCKECFGHRWNRTPTGIFLTGLEVFFLFLNFLATKFLEKASQVHFAI